jgi:hypothetical protein
MAILNDAPGSDLAARAGFCRQFFIGLARSRLDLARTYRLAGYSPRAIATELSFAASWRADAAAAVNLNSEGA